MVNRSHREQEPITSAFQNVYLLLGKIGKRPVRGRARARRDVRLVLRGDKEKRSIGGNHCEVCVCVCVLGLRKPKRTFIYLFIGVKRR